MKSLGWSYWRRGFAKKGGWNRNWVGSKDRPALTSKEELELLGADVKVKAKELGLPMAFITSGKPSSRMKDYEKWLADGHNGEMSYMGREDRLARRRDPSIILPGLQSIIMVGLPYWPGDSGFPPEHAVKKPTNDGNAGVVSCYAWGDDYHKIMHDRLRDLGTYLTTRAGGLARHYVDTGALFERDFAHRAGMGFIGKNSMLIHPRLGSGMFLGALLTTVKLPIDSEVAPEPGRGRPGCGSCVKCKTYCPTQAIVEDRVVDARKCISYLTIELRGSIPVELRSQMGARVYGCDICQQVCPWNRFDWQPKGSSPLWGAVGREISAPKLTELLEMDETQFKLRFRGTAVARIGRDRMARNAAVGLGNIGTATEVAKLEKAAKTHTCDIVREHAQWAVTRINERLAT